MITIIAQRVEGVSGKVHVLWFLKIVNALQMFGQG